MKQFYKWLLIFSCCFCSIPHATAQQVIRVVGNGEVSVVPDQLSFTLFLRKRGPSVSKLYSSVAQKTDFVLSYLNKEKIPEQQIQSMAIQVQPWFDYENQIRVQKGFELSRSINVALNDTKRLGILLDHLFRIGDLEIGSVNLMVSDQEKHYQKALSMAIESARAKATLLAKNLGLNLGEAVSVSELSAQNYTYAETLSTARSMDAPGGFLPGQIAITAAVEVHFAID